MTTIPVAWVHERLRIPEPVGGEATLGGTPPPGNASQSAAGFPGKPQVKGAPDPAALAALNASLAAPFPDQAALDAITHPDAAVLDAVLAPVIEALAAGRTAEDLVGEISAWYPRMDDTQLTELLVRAIFVAELHGRYSAQAEGDA
jgi:phage gp29-like protein